MIDNTPIPAAIVDDTPITPAPATDSLNSKMLATLDAQEPAKAPEKAPEKAAPVVEAANETNMADAVAGTTDDAEDDDEDQDDDDGGEQEDDGKEKDDKPSEPSAAMVQALKKYGVSLDLTEVPESARAPLVKKIAAMEAGYTKAMQDARSYRAEKAEFEAEKEHISKHTDKHIADLLAKDPALLEKVNAEMGKREDPTYREALELQRQTAKDKAALDAQAHAQAEADRDAQVAQLNSYVVSAVKNAKVPFALVEDAIVRADTAKYNAGDGFLTETEIDAIVTAKAQVYHRGLSGAKGAERRKYVEEKVGDKAKHANRTKPTGSGVAPIPRTDGKPLTMREKMLATLETVGA